MIGIYLSRPPNPSHHFAFQKGSFVSAATFPNLFARLCTFRLWLATEVQQNSMKKEGFLLGFLTWAEKGSAGNSANPIFLENLPGHFCRRQAFGQSRWTLDNHPDFWVCPSLKISQTGGHCLELSLRALCSSPSPGWSDRYNLAGNAIWVPNCGYF